MMKRDRSVVSVLSILLAGLMLGAACASPVGTTAPTSAPTVTSAPPTATTAAATVTATKSATTEAAQQPAGTGAAAVNVSPSSLGEILVGADGLTLYMFTKDVNGESACYDACATNWPPLLTTDKPQAGDGVTDTLLGTVARTDGSMQVTYNKMPLYYYAKDKAAGDVVGQGVGDVWYVIAPSGDPIGMKTGETPAGVGMIVNIADSKLGKILVDVNGMTLYLFTKDTNGESTCYDTCATNWPPLLSKEKPRAGEGVDEALLGTVARTDGSLQVTYNKMPLYYFAKDKAPGDTTGQDVNNVWYMVSPEGKAVEEESTGSDASAEGVMVMAADTALGKVLVGAGGLTLYMFTKDANGESACYDACATNWPPLIAKDEAQAGAGIDAAMLGTTTRKDGSLQVTYNKMPLYYFAKDKAAGDVTGQGVGDAWFVVAPSGEVVKATQAAAVTSAPTAAATNAPAATPTSAPAAEGALGGPGQTVEVAVLADFSPKSLTVKKGTTVKWTNSDSDEHTVTSDDGTSFKSASLTQGASFSFTFEQTGTYPYYCEFHGDRGGQGMAGTVTVVE